MVVMLGITLIDSVKNADIRKNNSTTVLKKTVIKKSTGYRYSYFSTQIALGRLLGKM